jgi:hypothetical protein
MNMENSPEDSGRRGERIGAKARALWQAAGSPSGRDLEFWLAAEHALNREREDVRETQAGVVQSPARSTPSGGEKTTRTTEAAGPARAGGGGGARLRHQTR